MGALLAAVARAKGSLMTEPSPASTRPDDAKDPSDSFLVRLVTNRVTTWLIRKIAAPLDPHIYKATNGRFTTMAPGSDTMVTITMTGRKSEKPRAVHLACVHHDGDVLLVASAMGQEKHPGWRYNLEANPDCEVQTKGESYRARARVLSDVEKDAVWDKMRQQIPMIHVYEKRTDRNIRVFRISRVDT
jgi:deazaflavin-dependent oxidoreductase (nitroreductase family)